jgi:hypothetical protein
MTQQDLNFALGYTVAALSMELLEAIICGRSKLEISEQTQAFALQMIDPSGLIISAAIVRYFMYSVMLRRVQKYSGVCCESL